MFFHMVYKSGPIFLRFCHNSRVWRTDGRTDRILIIIIIIIIKAICDAQDPLKKAANALDRVCIARNAVKTRKIRR